MSENQDVASALLRTGKDSFKEGFGVGEAEGHRRGLEDGLKRAALLAYDAPPKWRGFEVSKAILELIPASE